MSVSARLKSVLDIVSSLAVIVAAGVLVWKVGFASSPVQPVREPIQKIDDMRLDASRLSNVTGAGDVVIVEFTDFQCPFCGRHARDTFPTLRTELIDPGKAQYASINFPLQIHPGAVPAAKVAECAGEQGKFWEMHARLFLDATATTAERVPEHVKILELDPSRFEQCFSSEHGACNENATCVDRRDSFLCSACARCVRRRRPPALDLPWRGSKNRHPRAHLDG